MREPAQDAVTPHRDGIAQPPRTARRRPWIAGVCSAITPGLGQGYNGQATKALLWYGLGWGVGLATLAILLGVPTAPWNVAMPGLVVLSWYVYIILDVILTARRQGHTYHVKSYNKWYLYLLLIVIGAVIGEAKASTIRTWGTQAFKIRSGAMEETLLIGDHILVQKFACRQHAPARGDLVVFPFPRDPSRDVIKRVIGLPGDRIKVRHYCE
jgi:signal peptidase I